MKPKPGFDDEFQPKVQRRRWPVRSIGRLMMMVVAVCGVVLSVLSAMAAAGKQEKPPRYFPARVRQPSQKPQVKAFAARPRDPFVVTAAAEIDAKMVVPAPVGIDAAMVFNPSAREQQTAKGAPALGIPMAPLPVDPAGQGPYTVNPPQLPAPGQPR